MGCCTSTNFSQHRGALNTSALNETEVYLPTGQRLSSKRSYSSRLSVAASSGVFSRCSTPSKRSILSRSSLTPSRAPTPKPKPNMVNYHECHTKQLMPSEFQMLSICDDFGEAELVAQQQLQDDVEKSYGYFSRSINTPANSNNNSPTSTPSKSRLRCSQDIGEAAVPNTSLPPAEPKSNLEMEMYMMAQADNFMPKTSSPVFYRRDITMPPIDSPASASYEKWRNYLQRTPAYMTSNITRIPEAIAGQFSPATFPAFTDLGDMESAPKRFKVDLHQQSCRSIITTEL